jgi:hypothetical protein
MTFTTIDSIGKTTLPPGPGSHRTNLDIPASAKTARITINKFSWPGTGEQCGNFAISYVTSGGVLKPLMSSPFSDSPDDGASLQFTGSIDEPQTNRKIEIEWSLTKSLTFSATFEVQ